MDAGPAVRERVERGRGGQLAAAHREAQAVAGHRIDEAGGVAGQQQAVDRGASRTRPPAARARPAARRSRAPAKRSRSSGSRASSRVSSARGIAKRRVARPRRPHETDVGRGRRAPARRRCSGRAARASRQATTRLRARRRSRSRRRSPSGAAARDAAPGRAPNASVDRRPSAAMVTRAAQIALAAADADDRRRDRSTSRRARRRRSRARTATPGSNCAPAAIACCSSSPVQIAARRARGRARRPDSGLRPTRRARRSRACRRRAARGRRSAPASRAAAARASVPGLTVSPHSLSRGNVARSTSRTRAPARARTVAAPRRRTGADDQDDQAIHRWPTLRATIGVRPADHQRAVLRPEAEAVAERRLDVRRRA